jgi:hypothetical protein
MATGRSKMKKTWEKPELVVLVRSRPEESVLAHCKTGGIEGAEGGFHGQCFLEPGSPDHPCGFCSERAAT